MFDQRRREAIITVFNSKVKNIKCPMCDQRDFILADSYVANSLEGVVNPANSSPVKIPSVVIICSNCGFMSFHAAGPLGI